MDKQSQSSKILKLFKEKGTVTNHELNRICFRYGARIHELRNDGYIIVTSKLKEGLFSFTYKGHRDSEKKGQIRLL